MKKILALLLISITLFGGETYEDGLRYLRNGQYKKTITIWEPLARQGDAKAQLDLGAVYCFIEKDLHTCAYWARKAKENGKDVKILWENFELWNYK